MTNKVTLYVGLNDQDIKTQIIPTIEALKLASNACVKYVGGGTIYQAVGVYTHENGEIVTENTLRIEIIEPGASLAGLVNDLKKTLNQETIIIQHEMIDSKFV